MFFVKKNNRWPIKIDIEKDSEDRVVQGFDLIVEKGSVQGCG